MTPSVNCQWAARLCPRSEEHTSELQSQSNLVCRLLLEKKKIQIALLGVILGKASLHHRLLLVAGGCIVHYLDITSKEVGWFFIFLVARAYLRDVQHSIP